MEVGGKETKDGVITRNIYFDPGTTRHGIRVSEPVSNLNAERSTPNIDRHVINTMSHGYAQYGGNEYYEEEYKYEEDYHMSSDRQRLNRQTGSTNSERARVRRRIHLAVY
jgi:hypothetical protein